MNQTLAQPYIEPDKVVWLSCRSRQLRRQQTPAEQMLWAQLRAKRFAQFKFRRQQRIGSYIVDFFCPTQGLIVELDGEQHSEAQPYDENRDRWLTNQGYRVLRFWNNEFLNNRQNILEVIWQALYNGSSPLEGEDARQGRRGGG